MACWWSCPPHRHHHHNLNFTSATPCLRSTEQVIENHSKQQERQRQDDATELEQTEEDTREEVAEGEDGDGDEEEDEEEEEEELGRLGEGDVTSPEVSFASQSSPYADGRLVKSKSEAPIGSPKG